SCWGWPRRWSSGPTTRSCPRRWSWAAAASSSPPPPCATGAATVSPAGGAEGGARRFELTPTPLRDRGSDRVTGRVVELRDVTERHQAHERLLGLDQQRRWLLGRGGGGPGEGRRRIAGEVHDDPIQTIPAARLMLTTFRDQLSDDYQRNLLDHLEEAVSSSLARLRTLVFDLRPAQLDDDGLAAALREYLAEAAGPGGFVASLRDD